MEINGPAAVLGIPFVAAVALSVAARAQTVASKRFLAHTHNY